MDGDIGYIDNRDERVKLVKKIFTIPIDQAEFLRTMSFEKKISQSDIIRKVLSLYIRLKANGKPEPMSDKEIIDRIIRLVNDIKNTYGE